MTRGQTTIRLPVELMEQLRRVADGRGDSFNETVIRLLRQGMAQVSTHSFQMERDELILTHQFRQELAQEWGQNEPHNPEQPASSAFQSLY